MTDNSDIKALIRTIPDFPKPGIQFRDVTTLLLDPRGFAAAIERLAALVCDPPDLVAGIEARGFVVAGWRFTRWSSSKGSKKGTSSFPAG